MLSFVGIFCPYCGEPLEIAVDASAGDQDYIEDCQVCCRPIAISATVGAAGDVAVAVRGENDA